MKYDQTILTEAGEALRCDKIVFAPSDTVYALIGSISRVSISKLNTIKHRDQSKSYAVITSSIDKLLKYFSLNKKIEEIIRRNTPGKFTFIVKPDELFNDDLKLILNSKGEIGFRIPETSWMLEITKVVGQPILATSANLGGTQNAKSKSDLIYQIGESSELIEVFIDDPSFTPSLSSTVIRLTPKKTEILRQGSGVLK